MGDYVRDVGIPTEWEAHWVGSSPFRKVVWLAFFSVFQGFRVAKYRTPRPMRRGLAGGERGRSVRDRPGDPLVVWPPALGLSGVVAVVRVRLPPARARVIQEHVTPPRGRRLTISSVSPTSSNATSDCTTPTTTSRGSHWNRLPRVAEIAPDFYEGLHSYKSRWGVIRRFVFTREQTLYHHAVRDTGQLDDETDDPDRLGLGRARVHCLRGRTGTDGPPLGRGRAVCAAFAWLAAARRLSWTASTACLPAR